MPQQIAVQVAHARNPLEVVTYPAPEPRDIVWSNMTLSTRNVRARDCFVLASMSLLLLFWIIPVAALAGLLSYKEIKKTMPWLGNLIDQNDKIRAIVQNSLPSAAMITLNAMLPFALEGKYLYDSAFFRNSYVVCSLDLCPRIPCQELDRVLAAEEVSRCGNLLCGPLIKLFWQILFVPFA